MYKHLHLFIFLLALVGCQAEAGPEPQGDVPGRNDLAASFDAARTGTVVGLVRWEGAEPQLPQLRFFATPTLAGSVHPSPHLPRVESELGGLADAVVFLRRVDARRARPWHHGPLRIEHVRRELIVRQDGQSSRVGFVRRGDAIEAVSRDAEFHNLRGRGATYFSMPLPDRDIVSRRRLDQPGVVELSSGAGFPWMRAHLFVAEHPYYTRSDDNGRFALDQVPAGMYEVVCWLPSWVIERRERDAEAGQVNRLLMAPPQEQTQTVRVEPGGTASLSFTWSRSPFESVKD